ncbi:MAG: UDP-N-acetylmuramoyl-tripeptide--D-alanyl-D-alanine ligase [Bacteroidales bacterium]|nr:UDP-N-acetylmuramoyl-tripeptide--D-alanyl-D-alanine ligase [Bacteroidales bacterium]
MMTLSIEKLYSLFLQYPAVSTDSRQIKPGSLFFALRGDSFNGNDFAAGSLASGAAYAVVDEKNVATSDQFIVVEDVLTTLQDLARFHRNQFDIPVMAITGTNGKTTTKELIFSVLSKKYQTLATRGNLNNHIGVPLTLLNLNASTEMAIIEMGANHPGEIGFLCNIVHPTHGLITNIGKAHLEGFGNFEGVIQTKTELYRYISEHHGKLFVHNNNDLLMKLAPSTHCIQYGTAPADLVMHDFTSDPFVTVTVDFRNHPSTRIQSQLYGRYNVPNILAAACTGYYFDVPSGDIKSAIESYQPGNNRSQIHPTKNNVLILDAYNANPTSMETALKTFADTSYPNKTVILGDMLELGVDSDDEHNKILELLNRLAFPQVYLVGPSFTRLNTRRDNICFQDSDLAKLWLDHHRINQATILIKGSRGIRLEKLVESF